MDEILQALKKSGRAAFRTREYAAMLGKEGYARLALHRLKNQGRITSVKNGWWAFPDALPEAVACEVSRPAYVSFHSALFLHGMTTQTPAKIQVAVARRTRTYPVFGLAVKEYKVGKDQFCGFLRKDGLLLATPEKAVADSLMAPRACPEIVLQEALEKTDAGKIRGMLATAAAEKRLTRLMKRVEQERT